MKKLSTLLTIAASLALMTGTATAQRPGEGHQRQGPPFAPPLLKALDANHDGEISADEIDRAVVALKTLDKNKDGKLTREELRPQFGGRGRPSGEGRPAGESRRRPSGEGRGRPSGEGKPKGEGRRHPGGEGRPEGESRRRPGGEGRPEGEGRRHPGGEGRTGGQGQRGPGGHGNFIERLRSFDKNGDNKISKDELPQPMQRIMDRADTNGDGLLDEQELKKMAEHFQRGGGHHGSRNRDGKGRGRPGGEGGKRPQRPEGA